MSVEFDLLGDPIPEGWGKRGRPPHTPDDRKRIKVRLMMAVGRKDEEIAQALGITMPTLRKHYRQELKEREASRFRVEGTQLLKLYEGVEEGNVAANRELSRKLERAVLADQDAARRHAATLRQPKLGKKEQALADARNPSTETALGRLIAERSQTGKLN